MAVLLKTCPQADFVSGVDQLCNRRDLWAALPLALRTESGQVA